MYIDFLFGSGIILILLERDIGPCVFMNQLCLLYGIGVLGMLVFC